MKFIYIYTVILLVIITIFSILNSVWSGFAYFTLAFAALLLFLWSVEFLLRYIFTFKPHLEERFRLYKAEIINEKNISIEEFNQNEDVFRKKFKRTLLKEYFVWFCKIIGIFFLGVSVIVGMFLV